MEVISKLLDALKLGIKQYLLILIVTSLLLFSPKSFTDLIGLTSFVNSYRHYIGAAFLLSGTAVFLSGAGYLFRRLKAEINTKTLLKIRRQRLHSLNPQEKIILLYYFAQRTNTQLLSINDGTVRELEGYKIIKRTSQLSQGGFSFPYNLNPWAREYLTENPDLLEIDEVEAAIINRERARERWEW